MRHNDIKSAFSGDMVNDVQKGHLVSLVFVKDSDKFVVPDDDEVIDDERESVHMRSVW